MTPNSKQRSSGQGPDKKLPKHTDIAVVGAGPAGSAAAAALARQGRQLVLLERDEFPRDKVCGEFLSPETVDALDELGCLDNFRDLGPAPIERVRLTAESGVQLEVDLPGRGWGLSRRRLDAFLFDYAAGCGAICCDGADVRSIEVTGGAKRLDVRMGAGEHHRLRADAVVATWGRRTRLDRQLNRPFFEHRSDWVGFKRHHRPVDDAKLDGLEGTVELHAFDGGYCGVSFVEDGIVNICAMVQRRLLEREGFDGRQFWRHFSRRDTPLARRLAELEPCNKADTCAVAQIPLRAKTLHNDENILFAGDAAGMIAPLAGDGQAMAIEAGVNLAELIDDHFPAVPTRRWQVLWQHRYSPRLKLGRLLQKVMTRPLVATAALGVLRRIPFAARALVNWTRRTS